MPHALPSSKLLFSHGRFEPSPVRTTQLPASSCSDHDVKAHFLPSPFQSLPDRFCSRRRRASTGGYGGDDYHHLHETQQKEQVEEHDSGNSILHNFSTLAEGILAIWEGEDSVRRRIEGLGERQKAMQEKLHGAEAVQRELWERLQVLEQHAHEEQASLQQLKQERLHTLMQGFNASGSLSPFHHHHPHRPFQNGMRIRSTRSCPASSLQQQKCLVNSDAYHSLASATTNVPPLFSSSRQFVAFEMLESVHRRLTSYMWAHMCERVRCMHGEEERGEYLRVFRGIEGQSVFGAKPLSGGTYAELLEFIEKGGPREEVNDAMAAAERRLVEEACREGYGCEAIGDIRKQMAVYLQCCHQFTSAELRSNLRRRSLRAGSSMETVDRQLLGTSQLEIISDMRRASSQGTLGVLQPASKLIQLGCHFLCKSSKV